ncbi:MAG TPA: glucosamine-6-phosphate deaminase [Tepidisphaeraceae bacterium]|jgi:glucosamine-6-phosphate deaminase|nr:glucosamine-6-phosphate deaminase [Tepidisphaeraceae bacterium]
MQIIIANDKQELGNQAARAGAELIRRTIHQRGRANIVVATGASQFEMLAALVEEKNVPWNAVTVFHLDEYVGIPITHPASFRLFLWERFHRRLPLPVHAFHYIEAESDPQAECRRLGAILKHRPIDVAFIGIGENGHVAFNDPPANFKTDKAYIVVELDEACRRQQLGEGWFESFEDVPKQAISMSCRQILKSGSLICSVPDERKAKAVQGAVEGPLSVDVPASILQQHPDLTLYLDPASASLLKK